MSLSSPAPIARAQTEPTPDHSEGLYRHVKRPQWGLAILGWDRSGKRGYQFDDGTLRVFKRGFYRLFEEVEPPPGEASALVEELHRRLRETNAMNVERAQQKPLTPVYSFDTQLVIFKNRYPEGFQGQAWRTTMRGEGAARPLKRHRGAAIEMAQRLFTKERIAEAIAANEPEKVKAWAVEVVRANNLVGRPIVKAFAQPGAHDGLFASALMDLLHGEGKYIKRFGNWLTMLRKLMRDTPNWQLATVIPAVYFPEREVCVRPSVFKRQAASIAPYLIYTKGARRRPYKNYRKVAKAVKRQLEAKGYQPADMLDIYDFIWCTLAPSAAKYLETETA